MYKIAFIMSPMDYSYDYKKAGIEIDNDFNGLINVNFLDTYKIDTVDGEFEKSLKQLESTDFIFVLLHGGLNCFKSFNQLFEKFEGRKKFFILSGSSDDILKLHPKSGLTKNEYDKIKSYIVNNSFENSKNIILHTAAHHGMVKVDYEEPAKTKWEGVYYPGINIKEEKSYINALVAKGKPIVGVLFHSRFMQDNDIEHIDLFIKEIEKMGYAALAVYSSSYENIEIGSKGIQWVFDNYFMKEGKLLIDAIINTMSFSQSILGKPGDGTIRVDESIFNQLNVPVLQAMSTYQPREEWEDSYRGLDIMSLSSSVYYPEFDGQIITVTTATVEIIEDEIGAKRIHKPIDDRISMVCRLAVNWVKLRYKKNEDKKIAIIFHNIPPRNDMIGCAFGLDTPQSVYLMVNALSEDGITTEYKFKDGDEIIGRIINGVSNDTRWLSAEKAIERSVDVIKGETYRNWFSQIDSSVQEKMKNDWGTPPGEFMVHEDKLPVPGIINGNIFIGLQPTRGYEEKAEETYHNTDITPPHQYISFYRWLKNEFRADVVVHVGTHGTIEWLPGKEVGLSSKCFPDINILDMPHLYPYSITVLGEGIQAKRRTHAVILDHMIPSMIPGGTYDEMEEIDDLIKQYYQAAQCDSGKLSILQSQLIDITIKNDYQKDLNITEDQIQSDFEGFIEKLHSWVEELKNNLIKDGLHIYGKAPTGDDFKNLTGALLRIPNGKIPSITQVMATSMGYVFDELIQHPLTKNANGKTNLMVYDDVYEKSRMIIEQYVESGFSKESIKKIASDQSDFTYTDALDAILDFINDVVRPKLELTTDEMKNLLAGINGLFIPPGGGGSPTRGGVHLLPTGRNFYSIDPASVPTKASYKVGEQLGDKMLERHIKDEGKYPESVAIIVYAGETIKTCGDDVAEILYLMGIRPKWMDNSNKVAGLDIIPISELKRPRIDVTLRISGLFRDTFPNLIELIEEAVNMVSGLDEDDEENYIKKHFNSEVQELLDKGVSIEKAQSEASLRVFGDPPGTYGAGVSTLINSKKWDDYTDLGNVYTFWGSHAYGKNVHGERLTEVFAKRLSIADVSIKNESSLEIDMLESDDFYNYHGGLIAAIRTKSGKKPRSYCGDSSDPQNVKLNDVREQAAKIMRSRILNPKWFEGLKEHNYKGAQEVSGMVDYVFGWDATSDIIEDWMYTKIAKTFLLNDENREWIKSVNPWAIQNISERLLEAEQRGMWNADKETIDKLKEIYLSIEGDIEEQIQ